jgi:hypothetical protein
VVCCVACVVPRVRREESGLERVQGVERRALEC